MSVKWAVPHNRCLHTSLRRQCMYLCILSVAQAYCITSSLAYCVCFHCTSRDYCRYVRMRNCVFAYCVSVTTTSTAVALVRDGFDEVTLNFVSAVPSSPSIATLSSVTGLNLERMHGTRECSGAGMLILTRY